MQLQTKSYFADQLLGIPNKCIYFSTEANARLFFLVNSYNSLFSQNSFYCRFSRRRWPYSEKERVRFHVHVHAETLRLCWVSGLLASDCFVLLLLQLSLLDFYCCSTLSAHQQLYFKYNISQALAVVNEEFWILRRGECKVVV